MSLKLREIFRGLRLKLTTYSATVHDVEGAVYLQDDTGNRIKTYVAGAKREMLTDTQSQTITNKTIDVDNNTLSNIEVDNLKAGVLDTDLTTASLLDDTIPSAKATKSYADTIAGNLNSHVTNTSNPHSVTKTQVGLSNVDNIQQLPMSYLDIDPALTADSDLKVASQKATKAYTDAVNTTLGNHISNTSNPHSVTKTQVGLSNVDNVQQLPMSYLDTDGTLAANSDTSVASQKATKTYADTKVPNTRTVNGYALSADVTLAKGDVGLGSVDNVQQLPMSYLDIDGTLAANSDTRVASQKAVKTYVASQIGASSGTVPLLASQTNTNLLDLSAFKAVRVLAYVDIDSTTFETFDFLTVKRSADFLLSEVNVGDVTGVTFGITAGGFLTYSSGSFTTGSFKYTLQTIA